MYVAVTGVVRILYEAIFYFFIYTASKFLKELTVTIFASKIGEQGDFYFYSWDYLEKSTKSQYYIPILYLAPTVKMGEVYMGILLENYDGENILSRFWTREL